MARIAFYDFVQIGQFTSEKTTDHLAEFKLSHGLQIRDALIATTTVSIELTLLT